MMSSKETTGGERDAGLLRVDGNGVNDNKDLQD